MNLSPSAQVLLQTVKLIKALAIENGCGQLEVGQLAGSFTMYPVEEIELENEDSYSHLFYWEGSRTASHMRIGTEDRNLWLKIAPIFLEALRELPIYVSVDLSWRWDHKNLTESGHPTYIKRYQIFVLVSQGQSFDPDSVIKTPHLTQD